MSEEAIRQFEDYGYSMTEKGNITYSNMTSGGHDDAVSGSYFAVADVEIQTTELYEEYSAKDAISLIKNSNVMNKHIGNSFF